MRRRIRTSGFTLLELILVMAILVIVVAIMAPSLRGFRLGRTKNNVASVIVSLALYAHTEAINEGHVYRLNFDTNQGAVWLTVENGGVFSAPTNDYGQRHDLEKGLRMSCDRPVQQDGQYVEFQPNGRTDPAQIQITDSLGASVTVACQSSTELFHIVPPSGGGR